MRTSLLLIDMQNDFLESRGLEPGKGPLCAAAADLLAACREAAIPVIHIWTTVRGGVQMPHWRASRQPRCVEGTAGHSTPRALLPREGEPVVHKQFFSGFSNAELEAHLRRLDVDTLILAGVHLRACVRTTAIDAYQRDFSVWIADDAVADDDPVHSALTRQYLSARFVRFLTVGNLRQILAPEVSRAPAHDRRPPANLLPAAVVNGEMLPSGELPGFDHISPRDGQTELFRVPICGHEQIAAAAANARRSQADWSCSPGGERSRMLLNLASRIEANADNLARQIAVEIGKPLRDARQEVTFSRDLIRVAAACAASNSAGLTKADWQACRRPLGVVAVVTPWNNPLAIAMGKIAPALLHGNTVVWKPALPGAALALVALRLMQEAGLPPGIVNLIFGNRDTAEKLIADPQINAVTLTGSSQAGTSAHVVCLRRRIPFQGELGGNNAAIVWSDADLGRAAALVALAGFGSAGQRCTATRRVIVDRQCSARFVDQFQKAAAGLCWGDPLDEQTQVGPVVSETALRRIAGVVERARAAGATVLTPHPSERRPENGPAGFYFPPTIVCCNDPTSEIVMEETFGPVVVVQEAASWDAALDLCNGVPHGLVASLFTGSIERERAFLAEARAGILKINAPTAGAAADAPFGGWKASGIGPPEHGAADVEFYARWQTVYRSENHQGQAPNSAAR